MLALAGVGAPADDLRGRHPGGGVVHLVLHGGEKALRFLFAFSVVAGEREDLPDALVDARLAGADLADAGEQLVEVVHQPAAALEPLVVEREPLDEVLAQAGRGPLAELGAARALHPVADGQNGLEVVVLQGPLDLPSPFCSNL